MGIGDTIDRGDFSLSDEEIAHIVSVTPTLGYAAAACVGALLARYADQADTENDELKIAASQRFEQLKKLEAKLAKNPVLFTGKTRPSPSPFFGGIDKSENDAIDSDSTVRQPQFKHGRFDHPGTSAGLEADDDG